MEEYKALCRVCLVNLEESGLELVPLDKHPEGFTKNYSTILRDSFSQILNDEWLPRQVCYLCSQDIIVAYRLRLKIQNSDKILLEQLQNKQIIVESSENEVETKPQISDQDDSTVVIVNNIVKLREYEAPAPGPSGCGSSCDTCTVQGCSFRQSTNPGSDPLIIPNAAPVQESTNDTSCRFCGDNKQACNICTVDENAVIPNEMLDLENIIQDDDGLPVTVNNTAQPKEEADESVEVLVNCIDIEDLTFMEVQDAESNDEKFICPSCEKDFKTKARLKKHLLTHKPHRPFHCKNCKWSFATETELQTHYLVNHNAIGRNECVYCMKSFKEKRLLRQHMVTHKTEKRFRCLYCNKGFNLHHHLRNHEKTHTNKTPEYVCNECDKRFLTKDRLVTHMHQHIESRYQCETCNKNFSSEENLRKHEENHSKDRLLICSSCGLIFENRAKYDRHCKRHNADNKSVKPRMACLVCKLEFDNEQDLREHLKIHTNQFICDTCNRSFLSEKSLETHMKTHTVRDYVCNICVDSFSRADHLKIHMARKHRGGNDDHLRFQCPVCMKKFLQKGELTIHMRKHTKIKPYECELCDKSFSQANQLKSHMRLHTNQKPYSCSICQFSSFRTASGLSQHLLKTHTSQVKSSSGDGDTVNSDQIVVVKME